MTYSTSFGNPAIEAVNWNSLQSILEQLPDNTAQLISPRDVRDAIFTTWEQGTLKVITLGGENYIGTENGGTVSNFRYKMFFGKKELQSGNTILDNTLLTSDTDIFIYNNKSDSNLSLQDTKMSFLAGDDFTSFPNAPYIEATKTIGTSSNWIDLNITNPSVNGVIEINANTIELGNSGWVIDNITGDLYPVNDGQSIGLTGTGNRIGTIYMASLVDYLNDLTFKSGTSSIVFDTNGKITANSIEVLEDFKFQITATSGYFLSNDGTGNAIWSPGRIDTVGVTAGYMSIADGISDVNWIKPYGDATGVTSGYILMANGSTDPVYRSLDNLDVTGSTAGYVLGTDGSKTMWLSNVTGADGSSGEIQFNTSGFLDADPNLYWDNVNKRLSIGTSSPQANLHIESSGASSSIYLKDVSTSGFLGLQSSGNQLKFYSNGSERIRLDASGNVGIGVSAPYSRLHLYSTLTYCGINIQDINTSAFLGLQSSGDNLTFHTDGTEYMRLDLNGNLGIGTTTPEADLHIESTGASSSIYLKDNGTNAGFLGLQSSGNELNFYTSGIEQVRIDNVGNVGIGQSNPTDKLHIVDGKIRIDNSTSTLPVIQYSDSSLRYSIPFSHTGTTAWVTVATFPTANDNGYHFVISVIGYSSISTGQSCRYSNHYQATYYKNSAFATPNLVGSIIENEQLSGTGTADFRLFISGSNVLVQVSSSTTNDWNWLVDIDYQVLSGR